MSLQQSLLRPARQLAVQLHSPLMRRALIRSRFMSTETSTSTTSSIKLKDNAFNRERQAIKDHAAATSDLWRKLSIYAVVPCLIVAAINAYNLWTEHWIHWSHMPPLEERVEYSYQNVRTKNFPWGDGDKTIFWNSSVNYHKKD